MKPESVKRKDLQLYKGFRFVSHPLVLIAFYFMAPVSSEFFYGTVIVYFINGIIHLDPIIILPLSAIILVLVNWMIFKRKLNHWLEGATHVIGAICLTISVRQFIHMEPKLNETYDFESNRMVLQWYAFVVLVGLQVFYYSFYKTFGWDELAKDSKNNETWWEHMFTSDSDD